jgi:hypothetical protein
MGSRNKKPIIMPSNWKTAVSPKEVLDLNKDITMLIEGKNGTLGFYTLNIEDINKATTKAEGKIKFFEMVLDKIDAGLTAVVLDDISDLMREIAVKQKRNGKVKHIFNLEIQRQKEFIELFKIKKLIYTSLIKEKDLTKLGDLLLAKLRSAFSTCLELTEELVSLGRIKETEYLNDANASREAYDAIEGQFKLYNDRKDMIITNMNMIITDEHIQVLRR